jgi:hypothetical protein
MKEVRAFHALLALVALTLLIGLGSSGYFHYRATRFDGASQQMIERFREEKPRCPEDRAVCKEADSWLQWAREAQSAATSARFAGQQWLEGTLEAAGLLVALFYAVRWALTRRVRPLWVSAPEVDRLAPWVLQSPRSTT